MTREQMIRRVANQLYVLNGSQDGFADQDWHQAARVVNEAYPWRDRCVVTSARDGGVVIVEVSPGHSSYGRPK